MQPRSKSLLVSLAAGVALVLAAFCASALAKTPQTISFTSTPPSHAVAGEGYEVSARSSSGLGVGLTIGGACSFSKPQADSEKSLPQDVPTSPPLEERRPSPQTVYFVAAGTCTIVASLPAEYEAVEAERSLTVAGVSAKLTPKITWHVPKKRRVGGSGTVSARSSSDAPAAALSSATPSVCKLTPITNEEQPAGYALAKVRFHKAGRCTIIARVKGTADYRAVEARKSFRVLARKTSKAKAKGSTTASARRPNGMASAKRLTPLELARAEADADKFLALVVPPKAAVEIGSETGRKRRDGPIVVCGPSVFAWRKWHVSGEPKAVMAWIEAHPPARTHVFAHEESGGVGRTGIAIIYRVSSHQPLVIQTAYLAVGASVKEGGPTTLSAEVQVVPVGATCKYHGPKESN